MTEPAKLAKRRCLRSIAPSAAAMTKPAEPADASESECSAVWDSDDAADSDSDDDDAAYDREYFAGRYNDGSGFWFSRLALNRGRPDVEQHPQLCDCDVLVLEILGSVGSGGGGTTRCEFVVDPRTMSVTRAMREQLVQVELLAATPNRLTLAFGNREFGGIDDYDMIDKMSDPTKLEINMLFARAVRQWCPRRDDDLHDLPRSAVVLDAPTMVSTRTLLHPRSRLDDLVVTAVSNTTSRAEWWINQSVHRSRERVSLVRADIVGFLYRVPDVHDAIFLDHCGCITGELGALDAAFYALRDTGGVIAATYCVRGVGYDRTLEMFETRTHNQHFYCEWVCPPKQYGKGMVFFMIRCFS